MEAKAGLFPVLALACYLLLPLTLFAQRSGTGLIFDDELHDQQPSLPTYGKGSKFGMLPLRVDLRPYCPEVGDQGASASCVGWAVGYAAYTIEQAYQGNMQDPGAITHQAFSPYYIFNRIKSGPCEEGARLPDAFSLLKQEGDCLHEQFTPNNCYENPPANLVQTANTYRIKEYISIFGPRDSKARKLLNMKQFLAQSKPIIIGMKITESFYQLPAGTDTWEYEAQSDPIVNGHAMTVVGYHEGRKAFLIMNSWGENWGDRGFVWIPYDDFTALTMYAFVLYLNDLQGSSKTASVPASQGSIQLSGSFDFQYFDNERSNFETEEFVFTNAPVQWEGSHYELQKKDWGIGQYFRLVAKNAKAREYIYVLSLDPKGKVTLHWPKVESATTDYVPLAGAEIVIPSESSALVLTESGEDQLCVLFSHRRIESFADLKDQLQRKTGTLIQRLEQQFPTRLVAPETLGFEEGRMQFSTTVSGEKDLVPLIVKVKTL